MGNLTIHPGDNLILKCLIMTTLHPDVNWKVYRSMDEPEVSSRENPPNGTYRWLVGKEFEMLDPRINIYVGTTFLRCWDVFLLKVYLKMPFGFCCRVKSRNLLETYFSFQKIIYFNSVVVPNLIFYDLRSL